MGLWSDIAGAADKAALKFDESVGRQFDDTPGGGAADQIADSTSLGDTLNDGQDDFVLTGKPKQFMDTVFDYGPIKNQNTGETQYTDEKDVIGPSVDLDPSEGKSVIDWRSQKSQNNDPTSPQNSWLIKWLMDNWQTALVGVVALYVLTLLAPLFDVAASAAEG